MKQLLILSGKGGTGKTTIASAFIKLSKAEAYADCDVDAPNLHLVISHKSEPKRTDYYGLPKAQIDAGLCTSCDKCRQSCRFSAISAGSEYKVNPSACEGCGVCEAVCPVHAVSLKPVPAGELMLFTGENECFSTAQLKMGSGTSGKLVTEVKKQMRESAAGAELSIVDGSPGIGCPVIASISGADMVLIVAEPSLSGISDMERIVETTRLFGTKAAVCVNKYNTNIINTNKIESYCEKNEIAFAGKIPFDSSAVKAVNNGQTIIDIDCACGNAARKVFGKTMALL